ncbi:MAG: hypothetical protein QMD14_04045 [Candidatus Aenigmarchaeota archaeon]|nr:hypothetical protein [Candidatus Aenigmarchaeota archaeon]
MKSPKAAALIFSSGKIVCTGVRASKTSEELAGKSVRMIKAAKLGNCFLARNEIKVSFQLDLH